MENAKDISEWINNRRTYILVDQLRKSILLDTAETLDGIVADWPDEACKHGSNVIELIRSMAEENWG